MSGNQRLHHVAPETSLTDKYSLAAPAPVAKYPILNSRPNMMVQKMPVPKVQPRKSVQIKPPVVEYNPTPKAELEKQKELEKQRNRTAKYGEYDPATNFALNGGTNVKRKNGEIVSKEGEKIAKYSLSVDHQITRKDNTPSPILKDEESSRASSPNEPEATFSEDEELEAPAFSDLGEDSDTEEEEKESTKKETEKTSQKKQEDAKGADEDFRVFDSTGKSDKGLSIVPVEDILGIKLEGPGAKVKPVVNRNDKLILEKKQKEKQNKEKEKRKQELKDKQEKLKKKLDTLKEKTSPKQSQNLKIKTEKTDPAYEKYNIFINDSPGLDPNVKIKVENIKQEKVDVTKVKTEKENVDSNMDCDKNKNLFEKFLQSDKRKLLGEKTKEALAKKSEQKPNSAEIKSPSSTGNLDAHLSSSSGNKHSSSSSEKHRHSSTSDKEKHSVSSSKDKHKHTSSSKDKETSSSASSSSKDKHKSSLSKDKEAVSSSSSSSSSKDKHKSSSSKDRQRHSSSKDKHSSSSSSTNSTDKNSKDLKLSKEHKHASTSSSSKSHKHSPSKNQSAKSKTSNSSHKHSSKHHSSSDRSSSSKSGSDKHHKHQDKSKSHSSGSKSHDKDRRGSNASSRSDEKSSSSNSKQRKPSLEKQVSRVDLFGEDSDSDSGSAKVEVLSYLSFICCISIIYWLLSYNILHLCTICVLVLTFISALTYCLNIGLDGMHSHSDCIAIRDK